MFQRDPNPLELGQARRLTSILTFDSAGEREVT
jgi:hypothetical protein